MPRPRDREKEPRKAAGKELEIKERLYGQLSVPDEPIEEDTKKKKGSFMGFPNWYLWLCDFTEKHFMKKAPKTYDRPDIKLTEKEKKAQKELPAAYRNAFDFLGWKVDAQTAFAVPKTAGILGLLFGILASGIGYYALGQPTDVFLLLVMLFVPIFATLGAISFAQKYPLSAAEGEKLRSLTYVPEIVNYMIMAMRLQPNLEHAVEFASQHGEGRVADELKIILWKNSVGIYDSIEEGLDELAYKWGPYSEELKHSLTMLRASVLVPNDTERSILFDNTMDEILESTKNKMELYTRSMQQPSMYLFYIAVLLPLMIIIMLPVAAAFIGLPISSPEVLILLYVFLLPLITYFYAGSVLSKRPGGYTPPEIPDDYPGLPKKGTIDIKGIRLPAIPLAVLVFILFIFLAWSFDEAAQLSADDIARMASQGKRVVQNHVYQYFLPLAITLPISIYLFSKSHGKRAAQNKIERMEDDFKDVMYLLASRLGEKKPLEDSITYVKKFMPESPVATEIMDKLLRNIMVLGLTLRSAIFDPVYGAIRFVPSRLINSSFKILVDSIDLGPQVASVSLIAVSNQIRNIRKINDYMKKSLSDITGMMSSMATFIAPIVLGIVASLQQVITGVLEPLADCDNELLGGAASADPDFTAASSALSSSGDGLISCEAIQSMASPDIFQLIVGIYIIELVIILAYFAAKVQNGDNKTAIMLSIAKTLPIALVVFSATLFAGGAMMGGLLG
jgi:hypothetical protein